jgi:hypothetical protein
MLGDPTEVTCRTASFFGHDGVEDLATASFVYPSGTIATLVSVWHQVLTRGSTRRLEVFCESGHLWTDDDAVGPLHIETSDGHEERACAVPEWVDTLPVEDDTAKAALGLYAEASRRFLACVSAGIAGSPGAADAVAAHRLDHVVVLRLAPHVAAGRPGAEADDGDLRAVLAEVAPLHGTSSSHRVDGPARRGKTPTNSMPSTGRIARTGRTWTCRYDEARGSGEPIVAAPAGADNEEGDRGPGGRATRTRGRDRRSPIDHRAQMFRV